MAKNELLVGSSMYDDNYYINPLLNKAWQSFKLKFITEPYLVNSVWRSKVVNDSVGGSPNSYHLTGSAIDVDLTPADLDSIEKLITSGNTNFYLWLIDNNVVEFIVYKGHVHFAVDSDKPDKKYIAINGITIQQANKYLSQTLDGLGRQNQFLIWFSAVTITLVALSFTFTSKRKFK